MLKLTRLPIAIAVVAAFLAATASRADAAGCVATYTPGTHLLSIGSCSPGPDAPAVARISRTSAGAIQLDGQAIAGGPTVTNTARIEYDGLAGENDEVTLDMSHGPFAPGHGVELIGDAEIEIEIEGGTGPTNFLTILGDADRADSFDLDPPVIRLNNDADNDVELTNVTGRLTVDGQGGSDWLRGDDYDFDPTSTPLDLRGGEGNDQLLLGAGDDIVDGGEGSDVVRAVTAGDLTLTDTSLTGLGTDELKSVEGAALTGDSGPNEIIATAFSGGVSLVGGAGSDTLHGGAGPDWFNGDLGNDEIVGGADTDTVTEWTEGAVALADTGLVSSLGDDDTWDSIERANVYGSSGDDVIDATAFTARAALYGSAGADELRAGPGGNLLDGGDGPDELIGGLGLDEYSGGAGADRTFSSDGISEQVDCGDDDDFAFADALDGLVGCEEFDRGGAATGPAGESGTAGETAPSGAAGGPGPAQAPAVTDAADRTAPVLGALSLSRRRFAVAPRRAAPAARRAKGTAFGFDLSEPATVSIAIARRKAGRRVRFAKLGALPDAGVLAAGRARVAFGGRLGGAALRPGRYRATLVATDAAGNVSAPRRISFRVVR